MTSRRLLAALFAVSLAATACSGDDASSSATTTIAADTVDGGDEEDAFVPIGDPVNRFTFETGDCFNYYDGELFDGRPLDLTTKLGCAGAHEAEVYHQVDHPAPHGTPYPGTEEMERFALAECYGAFEGFVGQLYEISELEIGVFYPRQVDFEDDAARYRTITCYLHLRDESPIAGTMRGSER